MALKPVVCSGASFEWWQRVFSLSSRKAVLMVASFLILLYVGLPTKNHYWDGIGFALNIEGIGEDGDGVVRNQGDFRGISSIY